MKIPVYIVASGPLMRQMAGRAGDGVLMNTGSVSESIDFAVENVTKGAEEAGKDISEIDRTSVNLWSVAEDRKTAIDLGRPYVEWFMVNSPWLLDTAGFSSQSLKAKMEEMKANYLKYDFIHTTDWKKALMSSGFITDEMVSKLTVSGTPEDCIKKIKMFEEKGVTSVMVRHTMENEDEWVNFLRTIIDHVIPAFR